MLDSDDDTPPNYGIPVPGTQPQISNQGMSIDKFISLISPSTFSNNAM